jgi:hypothetical protein
MSAPIYTIVSGGAIALTAATAKTVLSVKAHANSGIQLIGYKLAFDGVTSTDKAVVIELCSCDYATAGTSSAVTPVQISGRVITPGFTAAKTYTAEPTTLVVVDEWTLSPIGGTGLLDIPLGNEFDADLSKGYVLRLTAPTSGVNVRGSMFVTRI